MAFGVFMMRKTIPSKHKIIHFSSEELFFSLNYSKNILLEQFKTAESHYDFLKNKNKSQKKTNPRGYGPFFNTSKMYLTELRHGGVKAIR